MAKARKRTATGLRKGQEILAKEYKGIDGATLKAAGLKAAWKWHYGQVTGLGYFSPAGGREVVIQWNEGGGSRKQGGISDDQWEIFRLAFQGTGKIAVLSDKTNWKFDYRFLEAQR